jgi:hypothetical protein
MELLLVSITSIISISISILIWLYCFTKILLIKKEIEIIKQTQAYQINDTRNIILSHIELVQALKDASDLEKINKVYSYNNINGEA